MAFFPTFTFDYISRMSKEEYFMRLNAYEILSARQRFDHVNYALDSRTIENDTRKVNQDAIAFNIEHPYQQFDYPYFEQLYLGVKQPKRSTESKSIEEKLKEERSRFLKIQQEVEEQYGGKE